MTFPSTALLALTVLAAAPAALALPSRYVSKLPHPARQLMGATTTCTGTDTGTCPSASCGAGPCIDGTTVASCAAACPNCRYTCSCNKNTAPTCGTKTVNGVVRSVCSGGTFDDGCGSTATPYSCPCPVDSNTYECCGTDPNKVCCPKTTSGASRCCNGNCCDDSSQCLDGSCCPSGNVCGTVCCGRADASKPYCRSTTINGGTCCATSTATVLNDGTCCEPGNIVDLPAQGCCTTGVVLGTAPNRVCCASGQILCNGQCCTPPAGVTTCASDGSCPVPCLVTSCTIVGVGTGACKNKADADSYVASGQGQCVLNDGGCEANTGVDCAKYCCFANRDLCPITTGKAGCGCYFYTTLSGTSGAACQKLIPGFTYPSPTNVGTGGGCNEKKCNALAQSKGAIIPGVGPASGGACCPPA